jgi:hypothetical protein
MPLSAAAEVAAEVPLVVSPSTNCLVSNPPAKSYSGNHLQKEDDKNLKRVYSKPFILACLTSPYRAEAYRTIF